MPRAGLGRQRVSDEAAALADEVGLDQLTLAALAERLGVRQPSLYKHIDSMADLKRSISLQAKRDLGEALMRASVGRSGSEAVRTMAQAYRGWAHLHPGRYQAAQLAPAAGDTEDEEVSSTVVQIIADVLVAYDLDGDDAIDAIRAFRATLHGFVALESQSAFALEASVDRSFERLVDGFVVALSQWATTSR